MKAPNVEFSVQDSVMCMTYGDLITHQEKLARNAAALKKEIEDKQIIEERDAIAERVDELWGMIIEGVEKTRRRSDTPEQEKAPLALQLFVMPKINELQSTIELKRSTLRTILNSTTDPRQ